MHDLYRYTNGSHGAHHFAFEHNDKDEEGRATPTLTCTISAINAHGSFVPPAGGHWHTIELRGDGSENSRALWNGVPGTTTVTVEHTLATPAGTVLLHAPTAFALTANISVVVKL